MGSADPRVHPEGGTEPMADARPVHRVYVDGFWMDRTEVTNAQFARFVRATGYVTVAERTPTAEEFPGAAPEDLVAGSMVFEAAAASGPPRFAIRAGGATSAGAAGAIPSVRAALRRRPEQICPSCTSPTKTPRLTRAGPVNASRPKRSSSSPRAVASRGGATRGATICGRGAAGWRTSSRATFPTADAGDDGCRSGSRRSPASRPTATASTTWPGNVWEWCSDWYRARYLPTASRVGARRRGTRRDPTAATIPPSPACAKRVHRGGSFLCSAQFCTRYLVGSRGKGESSHRRPPPRLPLRARAPAPRTARLRLLSGSGIRSLHPVRLPTTRTRPRCASRRNAEDSIESVADVVSPS